jgi:hypothetical protein
MMKRDLACQEKRLLDGGWKPIRIGETLLGWIKEPDMQIRSTDQAFKLEVESDRA